MTFELSNNFPTDNVDHLDGKVRKCDSEERAGPVELHLDDGRLHLQVLPELDVGRESPEPDDALAIAGHDSLQECECNIYLS